MLLSLPEHVLERVLEMCLAPGERWVRLVCRQLRRVVDGAATRLRLRCVCVAGGQWSAGLLPSGAAAAASRAVARAPGLRALCLQHWPLLLPAFPASLTELEVTDTDAVAGLAELARLTGLRRLCLSNCGLGAASVAPLCRALAAMPALTALDLGSGSRVGECWPALLGGVGACAGLTELSLRCGMFGVVSAPSAAAAVAALTRLTRLDLFGATSSPSAACALVAALRPLARLRRLDAGVLPLDDGGMAALARSLRGLARLEDLDLSLVYYGGRGGGEALAPALEGLASLTSLGLRGIGPGAAARLVPQLPVGLRHLDLAGALHADTCPRALARDLARLTALTHLDISHNRVADDAALAAELRPRVATLELSQLEL
jgi:hypothetical protein